MKMTNSLAHNRARKLIQKQMDTPISFVTEISELQDELDRAIRMLNDRQERLDEVEELLKNIKVTGSHYQIMEKIDNYFKEKTDS